MARFGMKMSWVSSGGRLVIVKRLRSTKSAPSGAKTTTGFQAEYRGIANGLPAPCYEEGI